MTMKEKPKREKPKRKSVLINNLRTTFVIAPLFLAVFKQSTVQKLKHGLETLLGMLIVFVMATLFLAVVNLPKTPAGWLAPVVGSGTGLLAGFAYYRRYGLTGNDGGTDHVLIGFGSSVAVYFVLRLFIG